MAPTVGEELGAQLRRLKGAGPKLTQFLSMVQLEPEGSPPAMGGLPERAAAIPFKRVQRVIEQDLEARVKELFDDIDEEPFALASLGQVHRARTPDRDDVAVKVQHPGAAEAVEADLRSLGVAGPILARTAPALDAGGVLSEIRERISDELDYEIEAQHQRRVERLVRRHPDVRVPHVHTALTARRVLVSDYVEGRGMDELGDDERDRVGEIACRFFFDLVWREGIVAGDPHPENCILSADGRLCVLDFGLLRQLDREYVAGEAEIIAALLDEDAPRAHDGLSRLGYLQDAGVEPGALLEFLASAGEWRLARGFRRIDPGYAAEIRERGYPPRSPYYPLMRRLSMPPSTLLLRRMELQLLWLLGEIRAGADWGAITSVPR